MHRPRSTPRLPGRSPLPASPDRKIASTASAVVSSPKSQGLGLFSLLSTLPFARAEKNGAVVVDIHVIPNASRTQADGLHDGALRVRLHAPPVEGKANLALIAWLAEVLGVAKSQIELVRGQTSKRKQLRVSAQASGSADWAALRTE